MDDSDDQSIRSESSNIRVLDYQDKRRLLAEYEDCIPKKNGASRDLGFYYAYCHADNGEVIVALDDDCEVSHDFFSLAESAVGEKELPLAETGNSFYNPLDLYDSANDLYPRGFPYEERGRPRDYKYDQVVTGNVVFNLGLWRGVFDINAVDKLSVPTYSFDQVALRYQQVAVQKGALVSACSMNMTFTRELVPAIYQLPMNEEIAEGVIVDRYGDIWGGYICKKLIDRKCDLFSVGEPLIMHHKTDTMDIIRKNIRQEEYAHTVNLSFCDLLDRACEDIRPSDYLTMYENLVENLNGLTEQYPLPLRTYLQLIARKMGLWVEALKNSQ